jgi:uncharacterized protein with ParB-like and HNH nuclease domain
MSYKSTTIADLLGKLNRSFFLPAIQRPFVWEPEQIVRLFDSLMQGYPISSFLFWDLKGENRQNWEIYKFIQDFKFGEIHDEKVESGDGDITLVLDGQQRLTSLLVGIKGTYTVRMKYQRKNNPYAWVCQALFLDLLKDPKPSGVEEEEDYFEDISYGFKFFNMESSPKNSSNHYWFRIGRILTCSDSDVFDDLLEEVLDEVGEITPEQRKVCRRNLERLYRVVWREETIAYYTEPSQSYDKVLDIFIRANDGGTKLSKSDLLMSMVTLKWSSLNARDEINQFLVQLNTRLEKENCADRDFILRSGLVLSELDYGFKVENFTRDNLGRIEANWPRIKHAMEKAFRTVNLFGIDAHNLTSLNAVMPIAYYFYRVDAAGYADNLVDSDENLERIRRWLASALLNGIFGGTANVTVGMSRSILREEATKTHLYPSNLLVSQMTKRGRIAEFDEEAIEKLLSMDYRKTLGFVALSLIYDQHDWLNRRTQKDYVFPAAFFDEPRLISMDIPANELQAALEAWDRIPNLVLLSPDEHIEKSEMGFNEWALTREDEFLDRHLLPRDRELYLPKNFVRFIKAREGLISKRLKSLFDFVEVAPLGKPLEELAVA